MDEIYLDNAATTKPLNEVIEVMCEHLKTNYGNPSSLHSKGFKAEKAVKSARKKIAESIQATPEEIFFTSGGSEGNNTIIKGIVDLAHGETYNIVTTVIEHPAILEVYKACEEKGIEVRYLNVQKNGQVTLEEIKKKVNKKTIICSIMGVNNEIGSINDLVTLGKTIKGINPHCVFHTDYVQGYMKIPLNVKQTGLDAVTICAHKIGGPKGIGALYIRKGLNVKPLILGGGQEKGFRSGTENVPSIIGFAKAVEIKNVSIHNRFEQVLKLKNKMMDYFDEKGQDVMINGKDHCSPYILSLSFRGVKAEVLLHALEAIGIYVSTGSACSSNKKKHQYVLEAIGLQESYREGTIRISFSEENTEEDVDKAIYKIEETVAQLRVLTKYRTKEKK